MTKETDTKQRQKQAQRPGSQAAPPRVSVGVYHAVLRANLQTFMEADEAERRIREPQLYRDFLDAAERGNPETLQIYLDAGINVNHQDPATGQTALHFMAAARARQALRVLLASGQCDFLLRDARGRLASELAYTIGEDPALARLLGNKERKQAEAQGIKLTRRPAP